MHVIKLTKRQAREVASIIEGIPDNLITLPAVNVDRIARAVRFDDVTRLGKNHVCAYLAMHPMLCPEKMTERTVATMVKRLVKGNPNIFGEFGESKWDDADDLHSTFKDTVLQRISRALGAEVIPQRTDVRPARKAKPAVVDVEISVPDIQPIRQTISAEEPKISVHQDSVSLVHDGKDVPVKLTRPQPRPVAIDRQIDASAASGDWKPSAQALLQPPYPAANGHGWVQIGNRYVPFSI